MGDFIHFAVSLADGRELADGEEISDALQAEPCAWVHLDASHPESYAWIVAHLGYLPEPIREALVAAETRPRAVLSGAGVLLNLRGVNLNAGAEPEDMISLRLWADPARIVTLSRRPLASIEDLVATYRSGAGPRDAGAFVAWLAEALSVRIAETVEELDDRADDLEERLLTDQTGGLRPAITDARAQVVDYRRFLVPQRDALARLAAAGPAYLSEADRLEILEAEDMTRRALEVVDALRDRLVVLKDELQSVANARLNRNLYVLSVVSAVFLPLGFLTGLMGVNLAGMPGADTPIAFWTFAGVCGAILVLLILLLWRLQLMRL